MKIPLYSLPALRILTLFICLLLTACITHPPVEFTSSPPTTQWQEHQQKVQQLERYQARGLFAYLYGPKKVYSNFFWQQNSADSYKLLLTNPLGTTELELNVTPDAIVVVDNKGKRYTSHDLDKTLKQLTGMNLPIDNIRLWMLGLPGESKQIQLTDNHLLKQLLFKKQQKYWHVTYLNYHDELDPPLPKNLKLSQGDLLIKLRVNEWVLP